jgi:Alpha-galactosidase
MNTDGLLWRSGTLESPAMPTSASFPADVALQTGVLTMDGQPVLVDVPGAFELGDGAESGVVVLRLTPDKAGSYIEVELGRLAGLERFTSGRRTAPFWMTPRVGVSEADVGVETQWLLARCGGARHVLLVPLLGGPARFSLRGSAEGLVLVGETGDPAVPVEAAEALLVAVGDDPYALLARAAAQVARRTGAKTRGEKPVPDFVDGFGWCTWDAFYHEVSPEGVRSGLEALARGGVSPRLVVLDDGWQSTRKMESGEERLVALEPNAKFGGDLRPLIESARKEFGVRWFFAWHAYLGYWGGLDASAFPEAGVRDVARAFGPGLLEENPECNVRPWGALIGVPAGDAIGTFYREYHRALAAQGVDGVKVDNQATLEAVAAGQGGRVALHRAFRAALEASVQEHFGGRMINCMSCVPECYYLAAASNVIRTSDDFYPQKPETHGAQIFANAHTSLWVGEFLQADWDMFQSAHPTGAFHAAARAISGGPIYVSDRPGEHDFALLKKLVLPDGSILRCAEPGRLTPDALFVDPTREPVALKIFNRHRRGGIVGLFNALPPGARDDMRIETRTSLADVPNLPAGDYMARGFRGADCWGASPDVERAMSLAAGEWELVTFARVERGFAPFGLVDYFNGGWAVESLTWDEAGVCTVALRAGGRFGAWAETRPLEVSVEGAALGFEYDEARRWLEVTLPAKATNGLRVRWS